MTWREKIYEASHGVERAYAERTRVFQAAHEAGLSLRQIAGAADLSTTQVHKVVGKREPAQGVRLDEEATIT